MDEYNTRSSLSIPNSLSSSYLLREPLGISTTMLMMFGTSAPAGTSFHRLTMGLLNFGLGCVDCSIFHGKTATSCVMTRRVACALVEVCYNRRSAFSSQQSVVRSQRSDFAFHSPNFIEATMTNLSIDRDYVHQTLADLVRIHSINPSL